MSDFPERLHLISPEAKDINESLRWAADRIEALEAALREPAAWLVTWTTKNNGPTASAYTHERDARDAARNVEKYADASNVVVAPAYTTEPQAAARIEALEAALRKVRSYNVDIDAGRINYRPKDHIQVIDSALAPEQDK